MSTIEVSSEALAAAQREAARRGVAVAEVVDEAVRRFVGGVDLHRLIEDFRREDLAVGGLSEAEAQQVASEELAAARGSATSPD